jgi:hypothetical protein
VPKATAVRPRGLDEGGTTTHSAHSADLSGVVEHLFYGPPKPLLALDEPVHVGRILVLAFDAAGTI